jgi:hypothetical protein
MKNVKELLEEAANLLSDVDNFGADDNSRRLKISRWLAKYESAQHGVRSPHNKVMCHCEDCKKWRTKNRVEK